LKKKGPILAKKEGRGKTKKSEDVLSFVFAMISRKGWEKKGGACFLQYFFLGREEQKGGKRRGEYAFSLWLFYILRRGRVQKREKTGVGGEGGGKKDREKVPALFVCISHIRSHKRRGGRKSAACFELSGGGKGKDKKRKKGGTVGWA